MKNILREKFPFPTQNLAQGNFLLGYPAFFLLLSICIGIVARTPKDVARVTGYYTTAPQKMKTDELPRIEKVMKNFVLIKNAEVAVLAAGLLLAFLFRKNKLITGLAIGIILQCIVLYIFNYVASMRGSHILRF
ncbi:hypothetical protein QQ054_18135 [Oscillatoria amoena NRMC-F 0135]|nr:hypothetical protein [Oscillatoria amoena NRMC-F 0135]